MSEPDDLAVWVARLALTCPGCGLRTIVDGRCTTCGSLKVPPAAAAHMAPELEPETIQEILAAPTPANVDNNPETSVVTQALADAFRLPAPTLVRSPVARAVPRLMPVPVQVSLFGGDK